MKISSWEAPRGDKFTEHRGLVHGYFLPTATPSYIELQNLYFSIMDIKMYFRIEDSLLIFVEAWLYFEPHA